MFMSFCLDEQMTDKSVAVVTSLRGFVHWWCETEME